MFVKHKCERCGRVKKIDISHLTPNAQEAFKISMRDFCARCLVIIRNGNKKEKMR